MNRSPPPARNSAPRIAAPGARCHAEWRIASAASTWLFAGCPRPASGVPLHGTWVIAGQPILDSYGRVPYPHRHPCARARADPRQADRRGIRRQSRYAFDSGEEIEELSLPERRKLTEFPVFSRLTGNLGAETGWQDTASATTQSPIGNAVAAALASLGVAPKELPLTPPRISYLVRDA